ncbi:hypothetical protein LVJ94_25215 [Pendulispora rubella]|uniref:non-specific serine/threonine protein kinase n=1 Tax=Pendulispora rubella TaxID=2741070 RepID=A0ABZ2LKX1_9BACT
MSFIKCGAWVAVVGLVWGGTMVGCSSESSTLPVDHPDSGERPDGGAVPDGSPDHPDSGERPDGGPVPEPDGGSRPECTTADTSGCSYDHATATCVADKCSLGQCMADYGNCNGRAEDGCEQPLLSDVAHCGQCGNVCPSDNGRASCAKGTCDIACDPGYRKKDGHCVSAQTVSAGVDYTCSIKPNGTVSCWGENTRGRATPPENVPFIDVTAGASDHTCGIRTDGTAACWGSNEDKESTIPVSLRERTFLEIEPGLRITCGLLDTTELVCWGLTSELTASYPPPALLSFGTGYTQISVGVDYVCALDASQHVKCAGNNLYKKGSGHSDALFASVAAGWNHTCGLHLDGSIECWGDNQWKQLDAPKGTGFKEVSNRGNFSCARSENGSVTCWGYDKNGRTSPTPGVYRQVSAGGNHACGMLVSGQITCWGDTVR